MGPFPASLGAFGPFGSFPFTLRRFKLRKPVGHLAARKSVGWMQEHLDAPQSIDGMPGTQKKSKGIHKGIPDFWLKPVEITWLRSLDGLRSSLQALGVVGTAQVQSYALDGVVVNHPKFLGDFGGPSRVGSFL